MSNQPKTCNRCIHWLPRMGPFGMFKSPHPRCAARLDTQGKPVFAEIERMGMGKACGPDAIYFEPKA